MIRAIIVPPDIPEGYQEIVLVFAEYDAKRGKTGTISHGSAAFMDALRHKPPADRVRVIKEICGSIEAMLLQYSSNPNDFKIREI